MSKNIWIALITAAVTITAAIIEEATKSQKTSKSE